MIQFRCWYCNRRYTVQEERIGERLTCSCKHALRIPKRSGGNCRVKTAADWLIETLLYGGGGALLGFGLAVLILSQWQVRLLPPLEFGWLWIGGFTLVGFLAGLLGGERGITWVGQMIRDRENS